MTKAEAEAAIRCVIDVLSSGDVVRADLEPEITQLLNFIEQSTKEKEMDCAFPCNGVCRSCRKPVVWVTMLPSMKPTPIDPELEHGGNVEIRPNSKGRLYAKVTGPDPETRKFISHFASCPHADTWRSGMIQDTIEKLK